MKIFVAPDGSIISMPEGRVIAYGLSPNEIPFIEKCLSSKDYELYVPDDVRDILAVSCFALIVEADAELLQILQQLLLGIIHLLQIYF